MFLAWLADRNKTTLAAVIAGAEATADTPKERILAVFDLLAKFSKVKSFYGCPFSRTLIELAGDAEHEGFVAAQHHKTAIMKWFRQQVMKLNDVDRQILTEQIGVLYEGVLMRTLITRSPKPAESAKRIILTLLDEKMSR